MGNSYCGKDCNDCLDKDEVGCPGCKTGPGKQDGALCEIASCCNGRLKEECAGCMSNASCTLLADRERMLEKWNGNRNKGTVELLGSDHVMGDGAYSEHRTGWSRDGYDAPLLRKNLMAIFWLFLVAGFGNTLSNFVGTLPFIEGIGSFIGIGASIAQAVLMIRLGSEERAYKVSGICALVATGVAFVGGGIVGVTGVAVKFSGSGAGMIGLVFGAVLVLAALVLELIGGYQFLIANERVVRRRDPGLSHNWSVMSKVYFAIIGGIVLLPILILVLQWFGIIITLLFVLGVLAFGICEYVFLYQTAERFRE